MTDNLASLAVAIGDSFLLSVIVKATMVTGAGLLAVASMRRVRASRRSLVLAWTFVVLGGLPVVAVGAGPFTVVVKETTAWMAPAPGVPADVVSAFPGLGEVEGRQTSQRPGIEIAVTPRPSDPAGGDRIAWGRLAGGVWAAGFLVCLLPMLGTMRRLRVQRRDARVWATRGSATVLQHAQVEAPMTYGLLRPVILLPHDLSQWSDADIDRALLHELEHVRRRDWLVHLFARCVCAFYWFHPLVWRAWRRMYAEADRACDDAVVSDGGGQAFAEQLVALAGRVSTGVPTLVLSMAAGDLSRRVMAIVDPRQVRGRSGPAYARLAAVIAIGVGAAIAPLKAVEQITIIPVPAAPGPEPMQPPVNLGFVERVVVQPPLARFARAAQPRQPPAPPAAVPMAEIRASITTAGAEVSAQEWNAYVRDTQDSLRRLAGQTGGLAVEAPPEYTLSAADVLEITIYRQPELSGEALVRPDGRITLRLLGDVMAAGLTPNALRERITAEMKRFVDEPRVTVTVKQFTSPSVFIVGEIMKPGAYTLLSPTTVLQLLGIAGGFTDKAAKGNVVVIRADGQRVPFDYAAIVRQEKLGQNIQLRPGDTVVVP